MQTFYRYLFIIAIITLFFSMDLSAQDAPDGVSADQKLTVTRNDQSTGGTLVVSVQVKGNNIPMAGVSNTLGSATIDIDFDNSKLTFFSAGSWAFTPGQGYTRQVNNLGTYLRVAITSSAVNGNTEDGTVGYDMPTSYTSWVSLTFTIKDASGVTGLSIRPGTNAIGLYKDHSNSLMNGTILNIKTLTRSDASNIELPVELTCFSASQSGNSVKLNWETATEVNNYGFEIQRQKTSLSGSSNEWEKIGFAAGHGNSNSPKYYSFEDKKLSVSGKYSYRLKQLDNDGGFAYSGQADVNYLSRSQGFALGQNYPNPFNPSTVISFNLAKECQVKLTVFNSLGKVVKELINGIQGAGTNDVSFTASEFPSGIYFYQIEANPLDGSKSFREVKRMMLVK